MNGVGGKSFFPQIWYIQNTREAQSVIKNLHTIVSYTDSVGCTSCKLRFIEWQKLMAELDSTSMKPVFFQFIFHPKDKRDTRELSYIMQRDGFDYPVHIDVNDAFNKLNNLPEKDMFHTFLLDETNHVVAIGNPATNPRIKDLYMEIITGRQKERENKLLTSVFIDNPDIDMGEFDWNVPQDAIFTIRNTGSNLLVIEDIIASCGCIQIDYLKEPVRVGNDLKVKVTYKADKPEYSSKAIRIYCNTKGSPIQLKVKGNAK